MHLSLGHASHAALVLGAAATASSHQLSIFDALVVEAAAQARCDELDTEDLADGATIRGVRIVNPFAMPGRRRRGKQ